MLKQTITGTQSAKPAGEERPAVALPTKTIQLQNEKTSFFLSDQEQSIPYHALAGARRHR